MEISVEDIYAEATSKITGRSQIAKAMLRKGYVKSINEAFRKYLSYGMPAYFERTRLNPEDAIRIIKESGGISSLAHLNQIGKNDDDLFELLKNLKEQGLDAIEGYYTQYTDEHGEKYRAMASQLGLKLTGGSDFHGTNKENHELGTGAGNLRVPFELLKKLGI